MMKILGNRMFATKHIMLSKHYQKQTYFHKSSLAAINVQDFVQKGYDPYKGDDSFLSYATERTKLVLEKVNSLLKQEVAKGVLDVDPSTPSTITAFPPGYIDKENELIVGLQTDKPLKRAIKPLGGINMVKSALRAYNYDIDPNIEKLYTKDVKTHNAGVFDAYTGEMRKARKSGILTGLPDGYGRGRIIGDYRRVPLYGVDMLIESKKQDLNTTLNRVMDEETIRLREEVQEQIRSLNELKDMAAQYGHDIGRPAKDSKEAVQWLYYAYLGAVKEQDGAAMSLGRIDAFLDIYFEKDLQAGVITEKEVQELIDDFVIKLRITRQLRTPEYNSLFAGDPTWATIALGGTDINGLPMVTKTSFRFLNTLYTLGPSPEPNITVLWNNNFPDGFKEFCAQVSIDTSSIQYENDALMSNIFGSDYGIACCVSAMRIGKDMQFFGARCNMPKLLLYVLNEGRDEISGEQVGPKFAPLQDKTAPLDYDDIVKRLDKGMDWLASLYCNTMNVIHFMHDKYNYEKLEMALHDTEVRRLLAFGISGLSVITDSLSAIKHARVTPIYDQRGIISDFSIEGDYPKYGNDEDQVDELAKYIVSSFHNKLCSQYTYRKSIPTLSILTITSNIIYGSMTGSTPDGRKKFEFYPPGGNPVANRETSGALASLNTLAKLPYESCLDGISNTFSITPSTLGKTRDTQTHNLTALLDGYFEKKGHHINVNVFNKETFYDAMKHPEKYPHLTVRISGYAVHFAKLTPKQQEEFINRTFHEMM
jgi:formate C-acetyltransferase